ncbi:hypothetical protein DRP05_09795 [Archaeoglobales archaeon]|nr:MAG: hypothetical protein DRP05_09795 [Archaeoglobales archaeon]
MRRFAGIIAITIFFSSVYFAISYYGNTLNKFLTINVEEIAIVYFLLLTYFILDFNKYTKCVKSIPMAVAMYFIFKIVLLILSNFEPVLFVVFKNIEFDLLLLLLALAVARIELPEGIKAYYQVFLTSIALILAGFFGYQLISKIPFDKANELGFAFLAFLVILAITTLSNLSTNEFAVWLGKSRAFLLSFTVLLSGYYIFIRPLILERTGLVNFFEWTAIVLAFIKLSSGFKSSLKIDETEYIKMHRQRLSYTRDELFERISNAKREFVENGVKSLLIATMSRFLFDLGWSEDKVAKALTLIVRYEDEKYPALPFKWEVKRIDQRNRRRREKVLKEFIEYLKTEGVRIG